MSLIDRYWTVFDPSSYLYNVWDRWHVKETSRKIHVETKPTVFHTENVNVSLRQCTNKVSLKETSILAIQDVSNREHWAKSTWEWSIPCLQLKRCAPPQQAKEARPGGGRQHTLLDILLWCFFLRSYGEFCFKGRSWGFCFSCEGSKVKSTSQCK